MHFELPRDFPSLLLALRDLSEDGQAITPETVTAELLSGDAFDGNERATLESEVAAALFTLSTVPLFQSEQPGVICPQCGALTQLVDAACRAWFLERVSDLCCQKCGQSSARAAWRWFGRYRLMTAPPSLLAFGTPEPPPVYCVPFPDSTVRAITTEHAFWQAVEDAARCYLHLPKEMRVMALAGYSNEGGLLQQVGAAVTHAFVPANASGYTALLQIIPAIWDTSYPEAVTLDDDDPTPGRVFDITLHEMIIEHLAATLEGNGQGA